MIMCSVITRFSVSIAIPHPQYDTTEQIQLSIIIIIESLKSLLILLLAEY